MKNNTYMDNERPDVSFVLMVFIVCGKKDIVVQKAAKYPSISIQFIMKIVSVVRELQF